MLEPRDEVGFDSLTRSFYCLVCKRQRDTIDAVKSCCDQLKTLKPNNTEVQDEG